MSPKIINGSFAAIFDNDDVLFEFAKKISQHRYGEKDCPGNYAIAKSKNLLLNRYHLFPAKQRRIRGMLMSGKQLSLDSRMDLVQRLVTDQDGPNSQIDESSEEPEEPGTPSDAEENGASTCVQSYAANRE